jgi:voltage-gated potassium channel Kch
MYRAYLLDLWLFARKVSLNAAIILFALLGSAMLFYLCRAWPGKSLLDCFVNAFYYMTLEGVEPPKQWYLEIFIFVLPAVGILFAAQGLIGAMELFVHRGLRQGEWNAVIAKTYAKHVVVCGLGQLGGELCSDLVEAGKRVVGIEVDDDLPAVVTARRRNVPVIIGDMTLPETLTEANVQKAAWVVVCSGDDLANIETAIVAKGLNEEATVFARVFKHELAERIREALRFDISMFSPYSAAAKKIVEEMESGVNPWTANAER